MPPLLSALKGISFVVCIILLIYKNVKEIIKNILFLKMSTFNAKVFSCFFTFSNMHISKQLYLCILYNYMFLMGVGAGSGS